METCRHWFDSGCDVLSWFTVNWNFGPIALVI
jgi:hypothetical protein